MPFRFLLILFLLCGAIAPKSTAQIKAAAPEVLDSVHTSHIAVLRQVGITDSARTVIRVQIKETASEEPIQGATILLRRDRDKILGRVTKSDGRCHFMSIPATYAIRVQLTGYQSFENPGIEFQDGKVYEVVIRMAQN